MTQVKIVNAINWCGSTLPNIIGCAPRPGNSFVVVRVRAAIEGILWAHEYGHNVGLQHRSGTRAIMRATINANNNVITRDECRSLVSRYTRYIDLNPDQNSSSRSIETVHQHQKELDSSSSSKYGGLLDGELSLAIDEDIDVASFVRQIYIHGTPMHIASKFENKDAEAELLPMLDNPKEKLYWGNIVAVLGMIGDKTVTQPLINFVEREKNQKGDGESLRQITAAMMGLGYLANRTGDTQALGYLTSASLPSFWSNKKQSSQYSLANGASIGLALSGRPEVRQTLAVSVQSASKASGANADKFANEMLDLHAEISQKGLKGYYAR